MYTIYQENRSTVKPRSRWMHLRCGCGDIALVQDGIQRSWCERRSHADEKGKDVLILERFKDEQTRKFGVCLEDGAIVLASFLNVTDVPENGATQRSRKMRDGARILDPGTKTLSLRLTRGPLKNT